MNGAAPSATAERDREQDRRFLNRYYGLHHNFYDLLRKYYLFGRDDVLTESSKAQAMFLVAAAVGYRRLMQQISEEDLKQDLRQRLLRSLKLLPDPTLFTTYVSKIVAYFHYYKMAQSMREGRAAVVNSF